MAKQTKKGISERTLRGCINDLDINKTWFETDTNGQRSGVGGFEGSEGSGQICYQRLSSPHPTPCTKKILTGFLCFAWTLLGSSGGLDPWSGTPPRQLRRWASVDQKVIEIS